MNLSTLWQSVLAELEVDLGKSPVNIYFRNSDLKSVEGDIATISFPNKILIDSVNNRYHDKLESALKRLTKNPALGVNLILVARETEIDEEKLGPLFEKTPKAELTKVVSDIVRSISTDQGPDLDYQKSHLSSKYTFSTLVVGSTNNFANAAAQGIVKNPGKEYNPFFIFGGVGVGKTHLMQAIGNEIYQKNPRLKILYTSAESFMNELIESFGSKSTEHFRKKYRNLDLLMIDDIQFISGKESTQDEIFHTFNSLHMAEKQIILTSDRRPEEIEKVESRIISRFMGGLTIDIQPPDFEMRTAILNEKLEARGEHWDREIIEYIASRVENNVRELEGTLMRLLTSAKVLGTTVNLDFIRSQFGPEGESQTKKNGQVAPKVVISAVAKQFGIRPVDLLSEKRDAEFVRPRQLVMYILRLECGTKYTEIAKILNRKDHTTVMHGVEKVKILYSNDPKTRQQLAFIKRELWG